MTKTIHLIFLIFLVFNLMISIAMAGRDLPDKNLKKPKEDVKHPDTFYYDRGYLIPGLGRGIKPKSLKGFNPFTYNPITGGNNGIPGLTDHGHGGGGGGDIGGGSNLPGGGGGGDIGGGSNLPGGGGGGDIGGGSNLPGGDDTLGPNPGVEVPDPTSSDSAPAPDSY